MAAVTICNDFEAQENKIGQCFHCFPICMPLEVGLDAMILVFRMLSFKPYVHSPLSLYQEAL